jgi:hypothetical protein
MAIYLDIRVRFRYFRHGNEKGEAIMSKRVMKPYCKAALVFLVLIFCLLSFTLSFHNHPEGSFQDNCPLCVAAAHLVLSASPDMTALVSYHPSHAGAVAAESLLPALPLIAPPSDNRAPPA